MTTTEQNLSPEQNELVAVGASVGAGCHPCVSHHLKAGAKAGLDDERLLAAVTSAERVSAEAAVAIGDHVRGKLGPDVTSSAFLSRLEEALASLGAAVGANDATNIERQLRAATELGASRSQLQQAIATAHTVQENAARIHLREAERLLDAVAPAAAAAETDIEPETGCRSGDDSGTAQSKAEAAEPASGGSESGGGCGCGSGGESEPAARKPEAPEPVAASSGRTAGRHSTAGRFGSGSAPEPMARCGQMFERFMGASARADTTTAPATATAGSCKKEA